jgi:hypothetical protein
LQRLHVLHRAQLLHALGCDLHGHLQQRFDPTFKPAFISAFKPTFISAFISTFKSAFKSAFKPALTLAFKPTLHPSLTPQTLGDGFLFYWRC